MSAVAKGKQRFQATVSKRAIAKLLKAMKRTGKSSSAIIEELLQRFAELLCIDC